MDLFLFWYLTFCKIIDFYVTLLAIVSIWRLMIIELDEYNESWIMI